MGKLNLCFFYAGDSTEFQDLSSYEAAYERIYKPLGALLFDRPRLGFSFYFTGPQIELFKKKNPEFLDLLKALVSRKQAEIVGGGFYNPLFPLLFPLDRSGQIEKLSLSIRQSFGRRPRGVSLFADSWDPSLILTLDACSLEYVLLDSSLIPPSKRAFFPVVMSDRGKTSTILPSYEDLVPQKGESAKGYFERLLFALEEAEKRDEENSAFDRTAAIPLSSDSAAFLLEEPLWLDEFSELARQSGRLEFSLPYASIKASEAYVQSYVHSGINPKIARWCFTPYESAKVSQGYPANIYDFFQVYDSSRLLYDRMTNVSLFLNQFRGDKMRKNAAREKLMSAQNGEAFICLSRDERAAFLAKRNAFKNLSEAEKILREAGQFKESVTSYDYNGDGFKEYVCRLEKYNACVSLFGGSVFELEFLKAGGNYAGNESRVQKYDGSSDNYFRGIFVDHIFDEEEAKKYCRGEPCKNGLFSSRRYKEISFSSQKQEILLEARARFSSLDQPILLCKKYVVKSSGILVQYILKNEGPVALKAKFAVEANLSELCLLESGCKPYAIEVVSAGNIVEGRSDVPCFEKAEGGLLQKVSAMQITDCNSNVSFMFTPNEEAGATYFPVSFKSRAMENDIVQSEGRAFSSAFVWDVDLGAGMEVEKNISLAISYSRRQKKK